MTWNKKDEIVENVGYTLNKEDRSLRDFKPLGQIHLLAVGCRILVYL